ncbi:universal stress protein [Natrialba sp. SSL1]|uniref:universal stress protein n=1 Tax=Natrialba sp. SSL1 TaxID=1869245 RepID=UPI0008F94D96|nr:universal stress protein [Natrialba sp. SSL1]OIB58790.1 universal stress protein UspA [Natrialba sp. SSL1]
MYQIVIPVDSEQDRGTKAAQHVIDLVGEDGPIDDPDTVAVSILNVFKEFEARDEGVARSEDLYDEDEFPDAVLAVRDELTAAGIEPDLVRRHGDPAAEIIDYANEVPADAIVLAGRKRSAVGKAVFGSVTQDVILNADQAVTVV